MELSILLMEQIAKLFIMIFMGYAVVKMGLLKDEDSKVLSTLVLYLIVPCVILNAFQVDYTPEKVSGLELACIASLLLLFILLPIVNLIGKVLHLNEVETMSIYYSNSGNLIVPLVAFMLGDKWVFYACVFMGLQTIFFWTHCKKVLSHEKGFNLKKIFFNINIITIIIAITLFFAKIRLPEIITGIMLIISITDGYNFTPADNGGRSVGFIGGTNSNGITVFSYGYIEGINYEAEKLGVNYDYYAKYDAGFADSATGSTVAGTYYNQGANIVFSVAGSVGDGVASKAKEEGKLAIQVDANKDDQQPGYVLTSVIKNTEVPVYDIVKEAVNGKIDKMDRAQTYSLASGAASITDLSEISKHIQDSGKDKWEEIKTEIKDVEDKISDGTIVVTDAQSGEEFDASKCPNVTVK